MLKVLYVVVLSEKKLSGRLKISAVFNSIEIVNKILYIGTLHFVRVRRAWSVYLGLEDPGFESPVAIRVLSLFQNIQTGRGAYPALH
jgi:hypothetical protein